MEKNLAVLGMGAIGSSVGADLAKAEYNVMLIDQWPAHVEAMKAHGLHVIMPGEEFRTPVRAFHLCELCSISPQLDIVFLAVKSYDTSWMVHLIKPYLKPDGVLVSLQNSLNDEWIAPIIGYHRDIACSFVLSAEVFEPGQVRRNTDHTTTTFLLGELHGRITSRLQEIVSIISVVGKTEPSTNIWGAKWSKLVLNTMMPFDAITGAKTTQLLSDSALKSNVLELSISLAKETVQVGTVLGYKLEPILGINAEDLMGLKDDAFKQLMLTFFSRAGSESRSHAIQDILKGRRTELDYMNGLVVEKGKEAGVATPLNEAVTSITRQIERGIIKPDISNLRILKRSA